MIKGLEIRTFEASWGWLVIYAFSSGSCLCPISPHPTPPPSSSDLQPSTGPHTGFQEGGREGKDFQTLTEDPVYAGKGFNTHVT